MHRPVSASRSAEGDAWNSAPARPVEEVRSQRRRWSAAEEGNRFVEQGPPDDVSKRRCLHAWVWAAVMVGPPAGVF